MDPAFLAQQATDILAPALPFIYAGSTAVVGKSKDMLLERGIEKLGSEGGKRAKALLDKISPKMGASLEKALTKVSGNSDDLKAKEELQQEILKLLGENSELSREIELIVNVNIDIDVVKQLVFGGNNLIFNLEGVKGEELIKIMEYMELKRQEELKQEVLRSYSPSILPDFTETLVKSVTENRAEELSSALKHLQKNKILLFSGIAGVGKTTLARVLVNFRPTGVPEPFWFNFYHNRDAKLEDVLEALAAYLEAQEILSFKGKRQAGNTDINILTEELRKRDSVWLVFDDLSYIIDEEQNFIDSGLGLLFKALRDNKHNAKIILTSRVMPLLENGEYLIDELEDKSRQKIEGLKPDFAVNYLRENGFENIELKTLESLVESVDGHPFSLKLLIGLAKKHTAENILKDLSLYRKHQKDRIKNARFLFDKLVGGEKELLERISVYRQPEPLEAIKIMFTDSITEDSIDALQDKSLLEIDNTGNYWLHPLVQEFSYEDLRNRIEAHKLAVKYYLSLPLSENPTKKEDLQPSIEAHYHACKAEEYDLAAIIIWQFNLYYYLDLWGNPRTLIEIYEKLLPENHFKDEPILKDKQIHGDILGNLGSAYIHLGKTRKAIEYYKRALKIFREIGDRRGEGAELVNVGIAYSNLSKPRKAIEYYMQALEILREIGDRYGEGATLGNLGFAYFDLGESRQAIEYYEQALKITKDIGERRGEGNWLGALGSAYNDLGEPRKAIEYHEQALTIAKEIGDRRGEGKNFGSMGLAYFDLGNTRIAIEYYEQALEIAKEIEDKRGEENHLGNLGNAYGNLGDPIKAIEYYEEALEIAKEIGNRHGEGNHFGNLGNSYIRLGDTKKAIDYYEQALKIVKEIEDRRGERNYLGDLGNAYDNLGDSIKAIEYYGQALKITKDIGERREEGNLLGCLGSAYSDLGEPRKAIEYHEQALKISREIGDRRGEGTDLGNMGLAYSHLGEPRRAIEYYEQSLKISREIGDRQGEGNRLGNMGNAYSLLGEPRKAIEFLKGSLAIGKAIEDPRLISFCEKKLRELDEVRDNENSNYHPNSNNSPAPSYPPVSKSFFQTIVSKLKLKNNNKE